MYRGTGKYSTVLGKEALQHFTVFVNDQYKYIYITATQNNIWHYLYIINNKVLSGQS